ncbi:uncharacterized protein LOC133031595 [Cannabis sativa]|uniref:uncharacterized protein LOC133031595 n=1 Tax=Cannabis sativa TaxID=3483 RepID=UPI0029CAA5CA|nr:uncharacterized protein LOC133031595 [Cannabis sativa]
MSNNQQYMVTPLIDGEHWMLILLVPDSYWLCFMDPKNSHLSNRPDIRETVTLAFQTYYRAIRKEIPPKLKVRRPTLSDANYTEEEIDEVKEHWASEMLSVIQAYRR